MKEQKSDVLKCFFCNSYPINRICLNEQIIRKNQFLLCDACRKLQNMKKCAAQIYEIDSFTGLVSLFSINSQHKSEYADVKSNIKYCSEIIQEKMNPIFQKIAAIEDNTICWLQALGQTFESETAQFTQNFLKNPKVNEKDEVLKKINLLKWFQQNKNAIQDPKQLSQKIQSFTRKFEESLRKCEKKMEEAIYIFSRETNYTNIFQDQKRRQIRPQSKAKIANSSTIKSNRKKPDQQKNQINKSPIESSDLQKPPANGLLVNAPEMEMEIQKSDSIQSSNLFLRLEVRQSDNLLSTQKRVNQLLFNLAQQKEESNFSEEKEKADSNQLKKGEISQQPPKIKKRPPKIVHDKIVEQIKPALVLQKVKCKDDYPEDQKLIVNINTIAEIFFTLKREPGRPFRLSKKPTGQVKYQLQVLEQMKKIYENSQRKRIVNLNQENSTKIDLQKIKYLQIQQLPRMQTQILNLVVDGKDVKVPYSLTALHQKIEQMTNLEQIHVFTSYLFPTEQNFLNVLFTCSNLQVVSFNCYNSINRLLQTFKQMISNQLNRQMKILQISGNIAFAQNMQTADLKRYFPESQKNQKIYDEYFSREYQYLVQKQKQSADQQKIKKNSCWFIPRQANLLQKQRVPIILTPKQNLLILDCFQELRNCWIPYLQDQTLKNQQQKMNIQKIQHLTLGFHNFLLQPIPQTFFFGQNPFSKSLTNIKSLNLINLNICDFFMKGFFTKQCKSLVSLKIQFCVGLQNQFYSSLPKSCPKLKKLAINNLSSQINGDFIMLFSELQTIILPWSEMRYNKSKKLIEMQNTEPIKMQKLQSMICENEESKDCTMKKCFSFINVFGCAWFNTDFFSLVRLDTIEHLNLGKCKGLNIKNLIFYLKMCENLKSLCLDQIQLRNSQLFRILQPLYRLQRLSVANCPKINFQEGNLTETQVKMLDQMSHLDLRHKLFYISSTYTLQLHKPKYLIISRGFEVQVDELTILGQRQIYGFSQTY